MKSVMKHSFSNVPQVNIPRSSFNRSHGHKTAFDSGYLIPVYVDEALPGDTFNLSTYGMFRLSTPIFPIMDNLYMDIQFFACPIRLIHDNFKKLMGEQDNPGDSIDYLLPTMTSPATVGYAKQTLSDYIGIPIDIPDLEHNSLAHRAYNLIWNTWYRDQNLQNSVVVDKDDGPDDPADYVLLRRGKRHDYFTSALPWPQKGDSVDLPLGTKAPIEGFGVDQGEAYTGTTNLYKTSDGTAYTTDDVGTTSSLRTMTGTGPDYQYADLTAATAATINQLRQAFQLQRLMERDARGGTRYIELIKSHFGVTSPDARQQRPEYLGGSSSPVTFTAVAETSAIGQVGKLSAYATTQINGQGFTKSFTEHTIIIGLASVRADLNYQQGLERMFSRSSRYDFYWPSLAQIGEQTILNKEIYAQGSIAATDDDVFGYQERYAEYRYKPSRTSGVMRSTAAATLDSWHLAQEFSSLPALNSTFIQEDPPVDRVIASTTEPHFIADFYFDIKAARPMPLYGVPGMIDHF